MKAQSTMLAATAALALSAIAGCGRSERPALAEGRHAHDAHADEGGHEGYGDHGDEVKLSSEAMKVYAVRVERAGRRRLVETISAPARVAFNRETTAHVGTPVEGRVAEIRARLGDAVRAGDSLLVIDSPALGEAQSDFLQKRAEAGVARAALEVAESAYLRAKELAGEKGISKGELLRREGEFKGAAGARVAAEAAAVAAENKLHLYGMTDAGVRDLVRTGEIRPRYEVRTPVAGIVVEREATLGEIVGPDRERLFVVVDPSVLWVLADVPEKRAAMVRVGAPARVEAPASAGVALAGSVSFIAPALSPETRTLEARIVVPGGEAGLRPGMYAQAEIDSLGPDGAAPEALAVPETAVVTAEGGPAVFVAADGEEGVFAKRAVTVGPAVGRWVPVLAGLVEGEEVVVSGAFILKAELRKASAEHAH